MPATPQDRLGHRLREVILRPFGEVLGRPRIEATVFFTYTFHRHEFEDVLLPEVYGAPTEGERTARLALLQRYMGSESAPVVFHDAHLPFENDATGKPIVSRAVSSPGTFRFETVPVLWNGGSRSCMHAKHVFVLVRYAPQHRSTSTTTPQRALVVLTTSANLTLAGWRQNVEVADIQAFEPGQRTAMKAGLTELCAWAWRWADSTGQGRESGALESLRRVHTIVQSLNEPDTATFPRLWTGQQPLDTAIETAAVDLGISNAVQRLSVGSPYLTEDAAPLLRLIRALSPAEVRVMRPVDHRKEAMSTKRWEETITKQKATLHYLRSALAGDKPPRTTHLKFMYVEGRKKALMVLGSPNLSDPAFRGQMERNPSHNFETAVFLEAPLGLELFEDVALEPDDEVPRATLDQDPNGSARPPVAPWHIIFDWSPAAKCRARLVPVDDSNRCPPPPNATLRGLGSTEHGAPLELTQTTEPWQLGSLATETLYACLAHGPFVEIVEGGTPPTHHVVTVIELHQEHAPPRARLQLGRDLLLRYFAFTALDDWERAEREADRTDRTRAEEELSGGITPIQHASSTLDRPISIIHAFKNLERRIRDALDQNDSHRLARLLFEEGGTSLRTLVGEFEPRKTQEEAQRQLETTGRTEDEERVEVLVCWLCARSLLNHLPQLPSPHKENLPSLEAHVETLKVPGGEMATESQEPSEELLDWLLQEWRMPDVEGSL